MKTKKFDCVEMMHEAAARSQEKLKGMSQEEEINYWKQREIEMRERIRSIQQHRKEEASNKAA